MIVVQCCELACFEDLTLLHTRFESRRKTAKSLTSELQILMPVCRRLEVPGSTWFNQMRFWLAVMPRLLLWTIGIGSEHDMAGQTKKRQRGFETRGQQKILWTTHHWIGVGIHAGSLDCDVFLCRWNAATCRPSLNWSGILQEPQLLKLCLKSPQLFEYDMCWGWAKQWFANRRAVEEEVRCNSRFPASKMSQRHNCAGSALEVAWHCLELLTMHCTPFPQKFFVSFLNIFYQLCHAVWIVIGGHEKGVQAAGRNQSAVTLWLQEGSTKCRDSCMMIAKGVLMFCWYVPYLSLYIGASFQGRSSRKGSKAAASRGPEVHVHIFVQNAKKTPYFGTISIHFHPISFIIPLFIPFFSFSSIPCLKFSWDVFMLWWFSWTLALQELLVGLKGFQDCGSIAPRRCRPSTRTSAW